MPTYPKGTIDAHAHAYSLEGLEQLLAYDAAYGYEATNFLSLECTGDAAQNALGIYWKATHPGHYAFAGLTHRYAYSYAGEARQLREIGFDGFKMLEGKPTTRKPVGLAVNDASFDEFYAYLSENGIPLLSHIADPEEFWSAEDAPAFAKEHGWFYGDGTFVPKQQLYDEMEDVLRRFPTLWVILAHVYFLSADLPRLAGLMETYPNVCIDMVSGREMYFNFSKHIEDWRAFFLQYQNRIIFGTDNFFPAQESDMVDFENINRMQLAFLTRTGEEPAWGGAIRCAGLPPQAQSKILRENFLRLVHGGPKPLNRGAARQYLAARLENTALALSDAERQTTQAVLAIL